MEQINWGIIGCGDVTEVKSGPAFNKVPNSALLAVMRRDAEKAADYAKRHNVKKWFSQADQLINDDEINAVYVATPPAYHEDYAIATLEAGKPVYVEKPMAMNAVACKRMIDAANKFNGKLTIAHYRRAQPKFLKIKELLEQNTIGKVLFADLKFFQPPQSELIANTEKNWRVDPAISGGGLFHDMAPHQLDLMVHFFGEPIKAQGSSLNQLKLNAADDMVSGEVLFKNDIIFNGLWSFSVTKEDSCDNCTIVGSRGNISFSMFGYDCSVTVNGRTEVLQFDTIEHVQQPMIEQVVNYFLGKQENPAAAEEALQVIQIMDTFTFKH